MAGEVIARNTKEFHDLPQQQLKQLTRSAGLSPVGALISQAFYHSSRFRRPAPVKLAGQVDGRYGLAALV